MTYISSMKAKTLLLLILSLPSILAAQDEQSNLAEKISDWNLKVGVAFQVWTTYTMGAETINPESAQFEAVDDRLNFQLHRSRLSFSGQPYKTIKFNLTSAYDFVGQDVLGGTEQPGNNGASPRLRLWNATVHWQLNPAHQKLNLTAGYFLPQIGRESITAALRSNSFEKAWSQNYLRRHLVGTGPGRVGGVNLGGLIKTSDKFSYSYDVGVFNPSFANFGGTSAGREYSPLLVGRLVGYFGDPEMENYTLGHKVNYFGKRNGLSLALSVARQGENDIFSRNTAVGTDFLLNWQNISLDGEWTFLARETEVGPQTFSVNSSTGYLRLGINFTMKNGYVFEPVVMHVQYNGEEEAEDQIRALGLGSPSGTERITDFGVNLYFNPSLKLSLFYTLRNGDSGELDDALQVNNFFTTPGGGSMRKGNMIGLGLAAVF